MSPTVMSWLSSRVNVLWHYHAATGVYYYATDDNEPIWYCVWPKNGVAVFKAAPGAAGAPLFEITVMKAIVDNIEGETWPE
jgi:hypothetical protein